MLASTLCLLLHFTVADWRTYFIISEVLQEMYLLSLYPAEGFLLLFLLILPPCPLLSLVWFSNDQTSNLWTHSYCLAFFGRQGQVCICSYIRPLQVQDDKEACPWSAELVTTDSICCCISGCLYVYWSLFCILYSWGVWVLPLSKALNITYLETIDNEVIFVFIWL